MKKILNVFLTLMILFLVSCDNGNGKPEDVPPVVPPEDKEETVYCEEVRSFLELPYIDSYFCLDELIEDGEFKNEIVIDYDYDYTITFRVMFTDYEVGKTVVPRYRFSVIGDNSEYNFTNKPGDSNYVCFVDFKLKDFYSLPSVKVTDVESGNTIYEKDFSDIEITNLYRSNEGKDLKREVRSVIDYSFGNETYKNYAYTAKNIMNFDEDILDDSLFEFDYDEYVSYLNAAYERIKSEFIDEMKEGALLNKMIVDSYDWFSFEDERTGEVLWNEEENRNKISSEIDDVYSTFENFRARYFEDYKDVELTKINFTIPKKILYKKEASENYYKFNKLYYTYADIYDDYIIEWNSKSFYHYYLDVGYENYAKIEELNGYGKYFYDGIFFNTFPGVDATVYEKDLWKERYPQNYLSMKSYQWYDADDKKCFEGNVSEKNGGLYISSDSWNNCTLDFYLSSLVYVEMYDGEKLIGKLRNPFFTMVDEGKKIKSVEIKGFVNHTAYADTKTDREGIFDPLLKKFTLIYMKDNRPVIYDTEKKYVHPYYFVTLDRKNSRSVYKGY